MSKGRIQHLLNKYIDKFGSISLDLPDKINIQIGITQEGKRGIEKSPDYCWVVATREARSAMLDKYLLSVNFDEKENYIVDSHESGSVHII